MRRLHLLLVGLSAAGASACPAPSEPPLSPKDAAVPGRSVRDAAPIADAPPPVVDETFEPSIPGADCPVPPRWVGMRPCKRDGWAYAPAESPLGVNPNLGRQRSSLRARWALARALGRTPKRRRITVEGYEVPEIYTCEGTAYALARTRVGAASLPRCRGPIEGQTVAPEGCPDWAIGEGWITDEGILGVARIDGARSAALARSSVLRRARHAAALVREVTLIEEQDSLQALTETTRLSVVRQQIVLCGGSTWAQMVIKKADEP